MLAYNSQGAINIDIAYTLPIHLRRFYIKLITDIVEEQNKKMQENENQQKKPKIDRPF